MSIIKITQSTDANGKNNEDSSAAIKQGDRAILCIADGIGGLDSGEIASRFVTRFIEAWAEDKDSNKMGMKTTRRELEDLFYLLHEELLAIGHKKNQRLGTTLTVAVVGIGKVVVCAVGDSRLFVCQDGECRQITVDQTVAEDERRNDVFNPNFTAEEKEHTLTQWLGFGKEVPRPRIDVCDINESVDILMCTDGLSDSLDEEDFLKELVKGQGGDKVLETLTEKAKGNGETDNITAVLYRRRKESN